MRTVRERVLVFYSCVHHVKLFGFPHCAPHCVSHFSHLIYPPFPYARTRSCPRARRPKVYSSATVGFGETSRSRNRRIIELLPCFEREKIAVAARAAARARARAKKKADEHHHAAPVRLEALADSHWQPKKKKKKKKKKKQAGNQHAHPGLAANKEHGALICILCLFPCCLMLCNLPQVL